MNNNNDFELTFQETTTKNQLFCQFDDHNGVLLLDIKKYPLTGDDFAVISNIIHQFHQERGQLKGVIIHCKKFPYWKSAQRRQQYINFARNNHYKFKKIALSMNGFFPKVIVRIAKGRIEGQIKLFKFNQIHQAQSWILYG